MATNNRVSRKEVDAFDLYLILFYSFTNLIETNEPISQRYHNISVQITYVQRISKLNCGLNIKKKLNYMPHKNNAKLQKVCLSTQLLQFKNYE